MADTASIGLKVRDKVIVITGGARGIGLATATALHKLGAKVAIGDIDEVRVKESGAALGLDVYRKLDVTDPHSFSEFLDDVERQLGPIDVLVNNAGIKRDSALHNMDPAAWHEVIETNLTGTFNYSRAVMKHLIRRGGAVVNVTSVSGIIGMSGQTNYSASKAGVIGFTKALAREVARFHVRVNAVAPGFIDTDMTASMDDNARKKLYAQIPLGKAGTPQQVARAVVYLSGDEYITGQVLTMDGGLS
jgi:NAD(P)-dependent dehydrogenase (short-subunit alcohol dehydrogenase family)